MSEELRIILMWGVGVYACMAIGFILGITFMSEILIKHNE